MSGADKFNRQHKKPQDGLGQRKADEQEEVQEQQVEVEQQQSRDTQQDQLGNQGVASMLGIPTVAPGSAGLGLSAEDRESAFDLDYGGDDDDDAPADGPQTLADLVREWNKGTQRGKDILAFAEPMPAEDLPPEDAGLLASIRADRDAPTLAAAESLDPLLQPSRAVIAGDMGAWLREAVRWSGGDLAQRTLAKALVPAAPLLQDPHGRVVFARTRAGALATLLMLDSPALASAPSPLLSAFVDLCLELAGQKHTIQAVWWRAQNAQLKLPVGRKVLEAELGARRPGRGRAVDLPEAVNDHLVQVMADLVDLPSATSLVPYVPDLSPESADDDDPLGLDALLDDFTGGKPDPLQSIYESVTHGAERLASAVARTRVRFAGLARALCEVGDQWTAGAPVDDVLRLVGHADGESSRILELLVEIAQAAKRRSVDPQGIRNGLRRAARMLDKLVASTLRSMARLVGGILPGIPAAPPLAVVPPDDPLLGAWADGRPGDALGWLRRQPQDLPRDAAIALLRVGAGEPAERLVDPLIDVVEAARATRPLLAEAAAVLASAASVWAGRWEDAEALARGHIALGHARRNGLLLAAGALTVMEVHHHRGAASARDDARYAAAKATWHMGQQAATTALLRWTAPEADPTADAVAAFFAD